MSWVAGVAVGLAAIGAAILLFRFLAFVAEWDVRSFEVPQDLPLRRALGELRDLLRDEAKRTGGERRTEAVRRFVIRHSKIAKISGPDGRPCVVCRARSIVRGEAPGTLGESLARREDRLREIDAKIASWRARRRA